MLCMLFYRWDSKEDEEVPFVKDETDKQVSLQNICSDPYKQTDNKQSLRLIPILALHPGTGNPTVQIPFIAASKPLLVWHAAETPSSCATLGKLVAGTRAVGAGECEMKETG